MAGGNECSSGADSIKCFIVGWSGSILIGKHQNLKRLMQINCWANLWRVCTLSKKRAYIISNTSWTDISVPQMKSARWNVPMHSGPGAWGLFRPVNLPLSPPQRCACGSILIPKCNTAHCKIKIENDGFNAPQDLCHAEQSFFM